MSLRTKKILLSVVSFALTLCVAFAVTSYLTNGLKPAYAETVAPNLEVKNVTNASASSAKEYRINGDGTISIFNATSGSGVPQIRTDQSNPYKNIIRYDIVITQELQNQDAIYAGIHVGLYAAGYSTNDTVANQNPRVHIFKDCIQFNNGWGNGSTQSSSDNIFYPQISGTDYTNDAEGRYYIEANKPYSVYFSTENQTIDGNLYVKMYFKLASGEEANDADKTVYFEYSYAVKALSNTPNEIVDGSNTRTSVRSGYRSYTHANDPKILLSYAAGSVDTYYLDKLEHDEDISYYWDNSKIEGNKIGRVAEDTGVTTYTKDDAFFTPDFDNRFTFKLKLDNKYGYFNNSNTINGANGSVKGGAIRIALGQTYSSYQFRFDFASDKIRLNVDKNGAMFSGYDEATYRTYDFDLDKDKEYKVSIVVRDVRDENKVLKYRLSVMDVAEIGNESHCITVTMLSDFLVTYGDSDGDYLPKHFRLLNANADGKEIGATDLCPTSEGCGYDLISLNPWKGVSIKDGKSWTNINGYEVQLPDKDSNKIFVGYRCDADNNLYAPGNADFSKYEGTIVNVTALYIDKLPEVINKTDMSFVDVKLRFKLEVSDDAFEALENYAVIDFVVKKGDEVVQCEKDSVAGDGTTIMTLTTGVLDASDYDTVLVASATITIEYANCDAQTIQLPGTCSNSASHIASYALENPAEFGVEAWNEGYIAEFERILAGGAQ